MPIDSKRVEAAARALAERDGHDPDGLVSLMPDTLGPAWKWYEETAAFAAAALFPELASDPPAAWVAPMDASHAMLTLEVDGLTWPASAWEAPRDAHTKEQTR